MSVTKTAMRQGGRDRRKQIHIAVLDGNRRGIAGATVQVYLGKRRIAELVLGDRPGSIVVNDGGRPISLFATYSGESQAVTLEPNIRLHAFVFKTVYRDAFVLASAEARCPNGKTGIPCVECTIGGIRVRVCV
jgi:hypothetical protein